MATVTGTQGNDTLIGTAQADLLQGLGGNDLLDGGLGNDTMEGGDGDDTYVVRDNGDVITEGATEGANDLAFVDVVNFALSSGQTVGTYTASANVEAVSALEQAGTQAFNINAAASTRTVAGNAGANIITGAGTQSQTLIGLAGNDAYNVSSNTQIAQEAAGGGTDTLNVTLAAGGTAAERTYNLVAGSEIETINLLGTAAVSFTGNATVQTVNGSAQNDTIDGGGGADFLSAGGGDDTIAVSSGVRVDGGAGTDRVISSTGYALTGQTATVVNTNVELLELAGRSATATTVAGTNTATTGNFLVGDQGAQLIIGDNGTNTLLGAPTSTGAGLDTLAGLGGNDVYRVYAQTDVVLEGSSTTGVDTGGFDQVFTSVDYSLLQNDTNAAAATAANALFTDEATVQQIEVLSAADQAGTTALTLTGNTLAQTIIGNAGANTLNTGGGTAIDRLIGLGGNDTYNVDVVGTVIEEGAGQGTADVANVSVTGYALTTDAQVEVINFTLTTGGTVTGNSVAQTINGNTGADTLIGGGGADTLVGGAGADRYTVDSLDDVVTEAAGGGLDTVLAVSNYALTAGAEVEVLAANGFAGPGTTTPATTLAATNTTTASIYLVGNEFAQAIYGSGGDNIILGSAAANGNAGVNDTLVGLGGNDTYRVFSSGDVVVEGTNGGTDIVFTNTNFSLAANTTAAATFATGLTDAPGTTAGVGNIETLSAASQASTTALTLLGDAGSNTIIGNNGSNILGGGAGNDTLIGLGRGDQFYFADFGTANADLIQDFSAVSGGDRILLNTTVFTGLNANGNFLADSSFRLSNDSQAATTTGTIVYDEGTGQLFYDANGTGVAGGISLIATVTPGTSIVASDIALTATAPTI
jgi:Ca2+-binding RTX toxin-like protein